MQKQQKLDIVGYAGVIVHGPGEGLMTSGQPILADKRLLKAAKELITQIKADAREGSVPRTEMRNYVGITLCETVVAMTGAGDEDEDNLFGRLVTLLALAVHSNNAQHMIVEGRICEDNSITILNFFIVPATDFEHGRQKIIRYFDAFDDLLAVPDQEKPAKAGSMTLH